MERKRIPVGHGRRRETVKRVLRRIESTGEDSFYLAEKIGPRSSTLMYVMDKVLRLRGGTAREWQENGHRCVLFEPEPVSHAPDGLD